MRDEDPRCVRRRVFKSRVVTGAAGVVTPTRCTSTSGQLVGRDITAFISIGYRGSCLVVTLRVRTARRVTFCSKQKGLLDRKRRRGLKGRGVVGDVGS